MSMSKSISMSSVLGDSHLDAVTYTAEKRREGRIEGRSKAYHREDKRDSAQ